ncbi:hypothetical protein MBLNU230_g5617t1 [Neophaeotheca triangularis]
MTDTSHPVTAITGHGHSTARVPATHPSHHPHGHAPSMLDGTHEDDGQISCICGFADDDGSTVACDICNRWQHIVCYYPQFAEHLPDDLQHFCTECRPRHIDTQSARTRQEDTRAHRHSLYNGVKRQPAKSHKKKVKEPLNPPHTNGWPLDKSRHDRNSASPRDLPPPAKRPKTSHRTSNSTAPALSRKRNGSALNHRRSLSRSPETSIPVYSDAFLRCYAEDHWEHTDTNVWDGIRVTNVLNDCITEPDPEFRRHTKGVAREEIFNRWNGEMHEIPGQGELDVREVRDDNVDINGSHPSWKWLTVKEPLPAGAFIGELTGHVGMKDEYYEDVSNRWQEIRHPEPFVFFHPVLPVYIDARTEGTELRYVRRSCRPNASLTVMVTGQTDCHFSFIAKHAIEPGEEITISWDVADGPPETVIQWAMGDPAGRENLTPSDIMALQTWVSTVLANCGPCACQGPDCLMAQFDRRGASIEYEEALTAKGPKKKKRKMAEQISPPNTGYANNSRSGSEARKVEPEDEPTDSRSASGSAGRGSTSRDNTPNTHYSANGSATLPEMSERERKKLAREEEIFRKQEEEKKDKQAKKKRHSGGSNLNTPTTAPSKHHAGVNGVGSSRYSEQAPSKHPSLPSSKSVSGKRSKTSSVTPRDSAKPAPRVLKGPNPVYVNAETQCDMDQDELEARKASAVPARRFVSTTQRLLDKCARNISKRRAAAKEAKAKIKRIADAKEKELAAKERSSANSPAGGEFRQSAELHKTANFDQDVNMMDADEPERSTLPEPTNSSRHGSPTVNTSVSSQQPSDPPLPHPPWQHAQLSMPVSHPAPSSSAHTQLHMPMPPPSANPFAPPTLNHQASSTSSSAVVQSPAPLSISTSTAPPVFSPSVTAAVNPSPARKKLSLSDYTKRSKAKDHTHDGASGPHTIRDSSPASASGLAVPLLNRSRDGSEGAASVTSQAVEDEISGTNGEDKPAAAAAAAATTTSSH